MVEIDFEGNGTNQAGSSQSTPNEPNAKENPMDAPDINDGSSSISDVDKDNSQDKPDDKDNNGSEQQEETSSTGGLSEGDVVSVDGNDYTVDAKGNLVDTKGNIFKEAKDVESFIASFDNAEETNNDDDGSLNIASIQDAVGIEVTDGNGNPIEFTNDANGIKSYIDSVISIRSNELQEAAINKLYASNPLLEQFTNYVKVNGTARGFGEVQDRRNITLDKDNVAQQEAIIRIAAKEFGNTTLNENYISYLKDNGALYDEAKAQLSALAKKDKEYIDELRNEANARDEQEKQDALEYWSAVKSVIDNRKIGDYTLPESFIKTVDGKKVTLTPDDFFSFVYDIVEDDEGNKMTGFQKATNALTDEELMNKELLDAWLMFTDGSYKDLISMATEKEQVRKLILKSKSKSNSSTVSVRKANKNNNTKVSDIVFDY